MDITESILQGIFESLGPIATIAASSAVIYGINTWHKEFSGKRRIELAEDLLTLINEARDCIQQIRSSGVWQVEGQTRKPGPSETPEKKEILDNCFIPIERYQHNREVFNKLQALQYRCAARLGNRITEPLRNILKIPNQIIIAANLLKTNRIEQLSRQLDPDLLEVMKEQRKIITGDGTDQDEILQVVNKAVEEIETICRPIIEKP